MQIGTYEVGCRPKDFPRFGTCGGCPRVEIYPGGASWEQRRLPVVPSFPTSSVTFPALHAEDISSQCGKGCSRGVVGRSLAGSSSIFCPDHLPLASDISVGSRTSSPSTRDKECSISHQSDILLLTDLLFRQLLVLSPKHSSSVGLVGSTLLTIDKGSEGPEIAALSHIALLQGPLQGEGKGSENVDSSSTPPLSPTRAPRPASRESCGDGGAEHNGAKSAAPECIACTMHSIACTTLKCLQPPPSPPILWPKATGKGSPPP